MIVEPLQLTDALVRDMCANVTHEVKYAVWASLDSVRSSRFDDLKAANFECTGPSRDRHTIASVACEAAYDMLKASSREQHVLRS